MEAQRGVADKGGTMRLGTYPCTLEKGTKARELYGQDLDPGAPPPPLRVQQRLPRASSRRAAWCVSGTNPELGLVEMIELPNHPYFVGCQFHPEFKSKPFRPHPLFAGFVKAAMALARRRGPASGGAEVTKLPVGKGA